MPREILVTIEDFSMIRYRNMTTDEKRAVAQIDDLAKAAPARGKSKARPRAAGAKGKPAAKPAGTTKR